MTERSRFWGGTSVGDAATAPYDAETEFAAVLRSLSNANGVVPDRSGIFSDELNLFGQSGTTSPVAIASGRALVDGTWYENDASLNVTIPSPSVNPRIDRIVLRKSFSAQTVRITRIAGAEAASPTAPAITQSAGVTWDMPICAVSINVAGNITLITDERKFLASFMDVFGDGSDGNVTVSTTVTLARDMYYNNLTVASGGILRTNGYKVFVKATLTVAVGGIIESFAQFNGNNAVGSVAGVAVGGFANGNTGIIYTSGSGGTGGTGIGAAGVAAQNPTGWNAQRFGPHTGAGGTGGNGGNGNAGVGGGGVAGAACTLALLRRLTTESYFVAQLVATTAGGPIPQLPVIGAGGGGGGAGAGDNVNAGGGGGGGGCAGGGVWIYARVLANNGIIRSLGGNGGNGGAGAAAFSTGGGGGGGGGSGGFIYIVGVSISAGTISVAGGSGGTGGAAGGGGGGVAGSNGAAGQAGRVQIYNILTQTWTIA